MVKSTRNKSRLAGAFILILGFAVWLGGCATVQEQGPSEPVIFPPPPAKARIQFLGSLNSQQDLPSTRSSFADFVLGEEPVQINLVKPGNAIMIGTNVYVTDTVLNRILVFDLVGGTARPLLGDRGLGKIRQPNNLTVDDEGRIYVADKIRKAILVYNPDESFLTAFGRVDDAHPVDVAVYQDEIFVCDIKDHEIEVWDRTTGDYLRTLGGLGSEAGQFFLPTFIAVDRDGFLYVTDTGNFRIQKLNPRDGSVVLAFGEQGDTFGTFSWPKGIDVDAEGRIYVVDSRFANVQVFNQEGRLLIFFGAPGPQGGNLDLPSGIQVMPWPSIPWLESRVLEGFNPEYLALVVSQQGQGMVNFFAVARDSGGE